MNGSIEKVVGRRVWDSRGRPTVEVDVFCRGGTFGRATAPAGASTGTSEAVDRRDGGRAHGGYDVRGAVASVNTEIAQALIGMDVYEQAKVDACLIELDGTAEKSRLGANAIVATSMATAHAAAAAAGQPLWAWLAGGRAGHLPLPEIQIIGGGAHAARRVDFQDFMVVAVGAPDYLTALDWTAEVYRSAGQILAESGRLQGVADEGGFWPAVDSNEEALDVLMRAMERAGLTPGQDMAIALDVAASEFGAAGRYHLGREDRELDSDELAEMLLNWISRYPIVSIEDPMAEDDVVGFAAFTRAVPRGVQVVGDDLLTTRAERIVNASALGAGNAALIKPNQVGTLTETKAAVDAARNVGWDVIISARSGESEDVTLVHLAVGWSIPQLKVGSFARSERMAKWNEALRIGEVISTGMALPPRALFAWNRG